MEMLRRARFGQDVTEYRPVAEDGNGDGVAKREEVVKRVHSYDNRLSLQLLTQYAKKVAEYRMAQGQQVTDGAQALAEIKAKLLTMRRRRKAGRSEEHTSELQSLMRISYAVFCLKKKKA